MLITDLVYIDDTGYHYEDYPTFLQYEKDVYKEIYGADVYLEADSEDGQLIAARAKANFDLAALGAAIYNSFSPATGQGVGLSRNVKINGLTRRIPTNSTADLLIVGASGTVITNGIAIDTLERKWDLPASVLIPIGGSITVTATAQELGSIAAESNTINRIFTPTLGWQTVNNVADATLGAPVETDAELRLRQAASTAVPSQTVLDGTVGGVANISGVTKVRGYENDTNSTDGDGLLAHSIALIVAGGDAEEIAQEILLHKTPGTYTNGTTSETVYDSHGMPVVIRFFRPEVLTIKVEITISVNTAWSNDFIPLIQDAVADTINAGRIGDTILITKLFAPAYLIGTAAGESFDIASLEIAIEGDPMGTVNIPLDFDQEALCVGADDVTVNVT
jgi:uncharacterized phage protein gp47/JayE